MSHSSPKPVAIVIAAQMRIAMPKTAQTHRPAPVNVNRALKRAANSSPAAKAAFKRAAPAVKAATPHLKALAQPGKGLLSSLRHGVSAMHSLRQVTREMGKEKGAALPHSAASSVAPAFNAAAASSPTAASAFKRATPAVAKAQQHVRALSKLQESPNRSLLSSLGHGFQTMRALRQVTEGMRGGSGFAAIEPAHVQSAPGKSPSMKLSHGRHGAGHNGAASSPVAQASTPFAAMLIVRRDTRALSSFKDRT